MVKAVSSQMRKFAAVTVFQGRKEGRRVKEDCTELCDWPTGQQGWLEAACRKQEGTSAWKRDG